MTKGKAKGRCKGRPKDPREKQYSMETAMDVENLDTRREDVHKWGKDSKGTATHADAQDTHGTNVQSSRTDKEKEKEERTKLKQEMNKCT